MSAKTGLNTKTWNDDDFLRVEKRFARKQPTAAVMLTVVGARDNLSDLMKDFGSPQKGNPRHGLRYAPI